MKSEKDFIEIKTFNQKESFSYLKKKFKHLKDDDIQKLIDHIQVDNQC